MRSAAGSTSHPEVSTFYSSWPLQMFSCSSSHRQQQHRHHQQQLWMRGRGYPLDYTQHHLPYTTTDPPAHPRVEASDICAHVDLPFPSRRPAKLGCFIWVAVGILLPKQHFHISLSCRPREHHFSLHERSLPLVLPFLRRLCVEMPSRLRLPAFNTRCLSLMQVHAPAALKAPPQHPGSSHDRHCERRAVCMRKHIRLPSLG